MSDPLALDIPSLDECQSGQPRPASLNGNNANRPAAVSTPAPSPTQQRLRATRGFNVLIWRGRLASDPELRESSSGKRYLRVRCLQDQPDRNGQPGTQGVEIAVFDERAEHFAAFFRKGDEVLVKGRLTIETKSDGQGFRTTVSLHPEGPIELLHRPQARSNAG